MALTGGERRKLAAAGNRLAATLTIAADNLTDAVVNHVRTALADRELLKVRIHTDTAEECDVAAAELANRVPCDLVQRVGRVALLYRAIPVS